MLGNALKCSKVANAVIPAATDGRDSIPIYSVVPMSVTALSILNVLGPVP